MTENNTEPQQAPAPSYPGAGTPMYQAPTEFYRPPQPAPVEPKGTGRKRFVLPATLLLGGLLVGGGIGVANRPAPVVEVQTKTETKTVNVTPAACVDALDQADSGFTSVSQAIGYMGDAIHGAASFDVAAINKANSSMDGLQPELTRIMGKYRTARDSCRASR